MGELLERAYLDVEEVGLEQCIEVLAMILCTLCSHAWLPGTARYSMQNDFLHLMTQLYSVVM